MATKRPNLADRIGTDLPSAADVLFGTKPPPPAPAPAPRERTPKPKVKPTTTATQVHLDNPTRDHIEAIRTAARHQGAPAISMSVIIRYAVGELAVRESPTDSVRKLQP